MTRLFSGTATEPGLKFALMIRDLNLALSRHSSPDLAELGLSQAQIPVLAAIDELPGSTGCELAEATHTTPQAVSQILARLTECGMVRRESLGGRAMGHHLTDKGRTATYAARARFGSLTESFLTVLDDDDQAVMIDALWRVLNAMVDADDEKPQRETGP
ncbi:MarR family winged helix-turn-helix transcriptional regulator [Gordonia liuliyuniae]|uniref:MarR family winged helix-turn-helix transcriptional regulator n=1 Tax=Gordonia liuliyuniae TaxID=2911517 RepID=A0ABS9IT75_9ACTN|nr:MarR family winged helix-turn-helix transcriptional regulator [Gordonia liuliyuniae]MCF8588759.1 MarR family winged helix-turn-helix transcriptional regulator [Gordonia liuliyuniae]